MGPLPVHRDRRSVQSRARAMPAHQNPAFTADPITETPADLEMTSPALEVRRLCVLGSGDFGRAIARRAVTSGFTVNIGTRSKDKQE